MVDLGYETQNSIMNLGSIFIMLCYVVIKLVMLCLLKLIFLINDTCCPSRKDNMQTLRGFYQRNIKSLIFGSFITLFLEAYIEFIISGILNTSNPINS